MTKRDIRVRLEKLEKALGELAVDGESDSKTDVLLAQQHVNWAIAALEGGCRGD